MYLALIAVTDLAAYEQFMTHHLPTHPSSPKSNSASP
jgi:hypothetical protein